MLWHALPSLNLRADQRFVHHGSKHCPGNGEQEGGTRAKLVLFVL